MGAELFYSHGQTDTTKLKFAFRNFSNAPENCIFQYIYYPIILRIKTNYLLAQH
jgi:hypothetical protein